MALRAQVPARYRSERLGPWALGIDEKSAAYAVAQGKCRNAQNLILDENIGEAEKRPGSRQISTLPSGLPARDTHVFTKADGTTFLLASDGASLYRTSDPNIQANWILLRSGLNPDGFMQFETFDDKAWMTNGINPVAAWDGNALTVYDREFTATSNNNNTTTTSLRNSGLTGATGFWVGQKIVFTTGVHVGTVVVVTAYDSALQELTFTPALSSSVGNATRFKVGLIIPIARAIRVWDGKLWVGGTGGNLSELRFSALVDPNTGNPIRPDHPLAWPATNQIEVYASDGARVSGISPVLRDRFLVFKRSGLFRIERDPLTLYRPEIMSRAVGCRFPRSWAEKKGLLYFVGQDRDGLPDIFKTDMVTVEPVDPIGGLEPTLRSLKQPNVVARSSILSNQADFDAGTKSTGVKTSNNKIEIGGIDSDTDWATFISKSNVSIGNKPGSIDILGTPAWGSRYEGDVLPDVADPQWTIAGTKIGTTESIISGELDVAVTSINARLMRKVGNVLSTAQDSFMHVRARGLVTDGIQKYHFGIWNGTKAVWVNIFSSGGSLFAAVNSLSSPINIGLDDTSDHNFNLLLRPDGSFKLWHNTVFGFRLLTSGTAVDSSLNKVQFGIGNQADAFGENPATQDGAFISFRGTFSIRFDRVYFQTDLKDAALLPSTLPASGQIVMQFDFTKVPDAVRRVFALSVLNGGTVGLESWSSDSTDFSTGNDPAGFLAFTNGAVPTSANKRYQRIRLTLTRADLGNGPEVQQLLNGIIWRSPALFIGSNITGWGTFLAILTTPAGTDQTIKIRRATVLTTPTEPDFGPLLTIVSGNNIGSILADGSPPTSRWIQYEVQAGPSATGTVPDITNLISQWNEGDVKLLPLHAIVHKKRYLFVAANATSAFNDFVGVNDRNEAWMKYKGWNLNAMQHFRGVLIGFSSDDAGILELDVAGLYRDKSAAIDAFVETKEELLGSEVLKKDLRFGYLHVGTVAAALETSYKRTSDPAFTGTANFTLGSTGQDVRQNFPASTLAKRIQRRYRNNVIDQNVKIKGETLYFNTRGQQP